MICTSYDQVVKVEKGRVEQEFVLLIIATLPSEAGLPNILQSSILVNQISHKFLVTNKLFAGQKFPFEKMTLNSFFKLLMLFTLHGRLCKQYFIIKSWDLSYKTFFLF